MTDVIAVRKNLRFHSVASQYCLLFRSVLTLIAVLEAILGTTDQRGSFAQIQNDRQLFGDYGPSALTSGGGTIIVVGDNFEGDQIIVDPVKG